MKWSLLVLIIFLIPGKTVCIGQNIQKDTVYLFFDISDSTTCRVDVEGRGYQMLNKFRKEVTNNFITFHICNQKFGFEITESSMDTISKFEESKICYSDIDYLIAKYKSAIPSKFKHHIFKHIYLVGKMAPEKFIKYEVGWIDESIGAIE